MKVPTNRILYLFIGFVLFALLVFHAVVPPGNILFTTDDNIGAIAMRSTLIPWGFKGAWDDSVLIGATQPLSISWTNLLLWFLPLKFFVNWIHAIDLVFAAFFLALFLRVRKISWPACCIGALTAFWLGSNFTLTYAGHTGKFGVLMFAGLYIWVSELAVQRKSSLLALLAGAAMGGMFLEQPDVALFFAMFLGPYTVYSLMRDNGKNIPELAKILIPLLVMCGVISLHPLYDGYKQGIKEVASADEVESPQAKWEFITQWSWPPEECIDFIAPGYLGWRSGESEGPYWGRMGRSSGWEQTGQGFQNFKLESQYLGIIPFVLLSWALIAAWLGRRKEREYYTDILFWGCAMLLTLLLSFGKYFPLYRLFAMLPVVSSIRNPNKFLQIFQVILGIMAAYGLDGIIGQSGIRMESIVKGKPIKRFLLSVAGLGALLLLAAMFVAAGSDSAIAKAAQGWGQLADVIVNNRISALTWAGIMTLLTSGVVWIMWSRYAQKKPMTRTVAAWALVVFMGVDVLMLSRIYVQTMDRSMIEENEVVRFLKSHMGYQRAALISQQGFYNMWLTYLFPYYNVDTVNITQMPRMPSDYKKFLGTVGRNMPRMWQLFAAQYILAPGNVWGQIQQDPALKDSFELVFAYNVFPSGEGGVSVSPGSSAQPGRECILNNKVPCNRVMLLGSWESAPDDQVLATLANPQIEPFKKLYLGPECADQVPLNPGEEGIVGEALISQYRTGRMLIKATCERPSILRISERYTSDWKVTVDGTSQPVLRCDYLFSGVYLPPGLHEVVFEYAPAHATLWVQIAGMLACVACLAGVLYQRRKTTSTQQDLELSDHA